jgi:hypothetical protein
VNSDAQKSAALLIFLIVAALVGALCLSVLVGQSDPQAALQKARRAKGTMEHLSDMRVRFAAGNWTEALVAARTLLKKDPENEEALRMVASCCLRLKKPGEAAAALKLLVDVAPEDIASRLLYMRLLRSIGREADARAQAQLAFDSPYATSAQKRHAAKLLGIGEPEPLSVELLAPTSSPKGLDPAPRRSVQ